MAGAGNYLCREIFRPGLKTAVSPCTVTSLGLPRAARVGLFRRLRSQAAARKTKPTAESVTDRGSLFYNLKRGEAAGLPVNPKPHGASGHLAAGFARAD